MRTIPLTDDQSIAMDVLDEAQALLDMRRRRFLEAALIRNGGKLTEPWQFEPRSRVFWLNDAD